MFWILLLAHFIADYPLQPNWMVRKKSTFWVLGLHVAIHLVVMLVIVGSIRRDIWLQLGILALLHFWIDVGKNLVYRYYPERVVGPYLIDQLCHYVAIWFVSGWITLSNPALTLPFPSSWAILATGFLLVTHVWFITERIIAHADADYRVELNQQFITRMVTRATLLGILLLVSRPYIADALALSTVSALPYLSGRYRIRALFTDMGVVVAIFVFICFAWFFQTQGVE